MGPLRQSSAYRALDAAAVSSVSDGTESTGARLMTAEEVLFNEEQLMEMGKATKLTSNEMSERCWSERSGRNGRDEAVSYSKRRNQIGYHARLVQASLPRYSPSKPLARLGPGVL